MNLNFHNRDDWGNVYCGERATEVHNRFLKRNIGIPIEWLRKNKH
jgi:hypothetical protein